MHRYIAFVWNIAIAERTSLAQALIHRLESTLPEWQAVLATRGMYVYHSGARARSSQAYLLEKNAGIILGTIFEYPKSVECDLTDVIFNEYETKRIQETGGRHLIEHYWGRYVALLRDDRGARIRILRDPTGAVSCFVTRFSGIDIICSHIADCAALGLVKSTINWEHIAAYLWSRRLVTGHTGLDAVHQVQAGECIAIDANGTSATYYWTPNRVHEMRIVEDRPQAMLELRTVIHRCVRTWASCYNHILHELSGGLDSAIVLACLCRSSIEAHVICETFFTESLQGDERVFARSAANSVGVDLVETPLRSTDATLASMLDATRVASPTLTNLMPEYRSTREQLVNARGIEVVFSGQGGDHFFLQRGSRLVAAEYAWRYGLRADLLRVIADTSRFTGRPIWSVMAKVLSSGLLRLYEDPYAQRRPPPLVSDATWHALDRSSIRHPWVDNAKHLPASKVVQILDIVDSQNFYCIPSHYTDMVHPLISQPIIELCLQIPSYVLTYGGIDRALVRDAFADIVPPEITRRRTKGATTSYINRLLIQSLSFLRELLLDGLLVRERVLDRVKVDAALTEPALLRDTHLLFPVLSATQAEAWLRTWTSDGHRAGA